MKRIGESKKVFGITKNEDLATLKKIYRDLIKAWHPDKFQDEVKKEEAEVKSTEIIEAYHFLVSISPETHEANIEEYNNTINNFVIEDFEFKGQTLRVTFQDKSTYEYFGVPKNVYMKFVNADSRSRFGRRQIFNSYTFRKSANAIGA